MTYFSLSRATGILLKVLGTYVFFNIFKISIWQLVTLCTHVSCALAAAFLSV